MASVLASQLQVLARQRQPVLPTGVRKGKPSLLYEFQKAADIDLKTIYDIAIQGIEELIRQDPRFRPYRESLFSRASLDLNPDLQPAEFLAKVGESIYGFCYVLSNHFLSPGAFKALEYLIRRYKANERNVDALMTAALPYHSTNEFVRLVQILGLGASGSLWGWLTKMQKSGASLPRDLLAQRCIKNRQLLLFICNASGRLGGGAATGSRTSALQAKSCTFLSFYAVLLCEVLAMTPKVDEDILTALLPHLLEGLSKSAIQDYRSATLMVLAELFSRATLGKSFIKVVLNSMLKHTEHVPEHVRTALLVMAHFSVTQQHIKSLSEKTLKYMFTLPNVVAELATLAQRGNIRVDPLLLLLVRSLSSALVRAGGGIVSDEGRRSEAVLLALAHSGVLRSESIRALASMLMNAGGALDAAAVVRESCQKILRVLDQRYPGDTDAAVNSFLEPVRVQYRQPQKLPNGVQAKRKTINEIVEPAETETLPEGDRSRDDCKSPDVTEVGLSLQDRARFDFVRMTFISGGFAVPCGETMLTMSAALEAPQAAVRRLALNQLDLDLKAAVLTCQGSAEAEASGNDSFARSEARSSLIGAALRRLRDDDLDVVVAALSLSCLTELPPAALLDALRPLKIRLGDLLYGRSKFHQLKAACQAARKVISLLQYIGCSSSSSQQLRQSAQMHLLAWMLPNYCDPGIAVDAAISAGKMDLPLFSELKDAMDSFDAISKESKSSGTADKSGHQDKKASIKMKAGQVERKVIFALAKALTSSAADSSSSVMQLVGMSASAATLDDNAAEADSRRVQHLLLLASYSAAVSTSAEDPNRLTLLRRVVDLTAVLLPYARYHGSDAGKSDWMSLFSDQIAPEDGRPTDSHVSGCLNDPEASNTALILGSMRTCLSLLPDASSLVAADVSSQADVARRMFQQLAYLDFPAAALHDLPILVITRFISTSVRSDFLSAMYAAPLASTDNEISTDNPTLQLQCLALHAQSKLSVPSVNSVLLMLLAPLSSPEGGVRSAAWDCLASVSSVYFGRDSPAPPPSTTALDLPAKSASVLCSTLLKRRKVLRGDREAVSSFINGALHPSSDTEEVLPAPIASEVLAFLVNGISTLGVHPAGVQTASVVLACLAAQTSSASKVGVTELFYACSAYLGRLIARLRQVPSSATALDGKTAEMLLSQYTPTSVALIAASDEGVMALSLLAEAAELLPDPMSMEKAGAPAVASFAAVRLAALRQVSRDLLMVLPPNGRTMRELFAVILGRCESDPGEEVRSIARTILETMPLPAELLVPLLDTPCVAQSTSATPRKAIAKKRSKTADAAATSVSVQDERTLDSAALSDAVAVLELLQWRTGISSLHVLVTACQAFLSRLLPVVGTIASVCSNEDDTGAPEPSNEKSTLAAYATILALNALSVFARDMEIHDEKLFDWKPAVRLAREPPDAAVRNAALGYLSVLTTRIPKAALSYVLEVLAVVNESSSLQDDEYSQAVGATVLAALVPAWVAAGEAPSALWEKVVSTLPSLAAHRRWDVTIGLMRAFPSVEDGLSYGLLVLLRHASCFNVAAAAADKQANRFASMPNDRVEPMLSDWMPELASQIALQVELPVRMACCARVMKMALDYSGQKAHTALPRTVALFVTAQLKHKVVIATAISNIRRFEPVDSQLDLACHDIMEAALAQMQLLQNVTVESNATTASGNEDGGPSQLAILAASRSLYSLFKALQSVIAADKYMCSLLTLAEHSADKIKRRALKLFIDKVRGVRAEIEDQLEAPAKIRKARLRRASDAAVRACAMLPPLLSSSCSASPLTRQLALVALSAIATEFGAEHPAALLAGMPSVLSATTDQHASIRASALATIATFVRALGAQLVPVLPSTVAAAVAAAESACTRLVRAGSSSDAEMRNCSAVVRDDTAVKNGSDSESEDDERAQPPVPGSKVDDAALELSSAMACMVALVQSVGGFLSPHLPSILAILLNPQLLACTVDGCDKFAASIRTILPTVIPPRLMLPALHDRLGPCLVEGVSNSQCDAAPSILALLQMMESAVTGLKPKEAAQFCDLVFTFLLHALDVRHKWTQSLVHYSESAINSVEVHTINAFVALVMKLSEARFKPLFLRVLEWATTGAPGALYEHNCLARQVVLFGIVNALADRLRSVLVPYYRYLLDMSVQQLTCVDGVPRRSKKQRPSEVDGCQERRITLEWLLRLRIMRALHRCFLHDSVGFLNEERFTILLGALVSQLAAEPPAFVQPFLLSHHDDDNLKKYATSSTTKEMQDNILTMVGPYGVAAVASLLSMALAVNNDALWKRLNHSTLMMTRHASARVRRVAVEVVSQLVDRLREEYLVLLPEALPFLSELLEDADAAVAAGVRIVILQLEEISGEKLDEYLKM